MEKINEYISYFKQNKIRYYRSGLYELVMPNLINLKTCKNRKLVKIYLTMVKIMISIDDDECDYGFIIKLNKSF